MKKIFLTLIIFVCFSNISLADFNDMPSTHWAYEAVNKMQEEEIISGYLDNSFRPSNNITLGEFSSIVCSAFNIEKDTTSNYLPDISKENWAKGATEAIRKYIDPSYNVIAERLGTIQEDYGITSDMPVTREIVIYVITSILGYGQEEEDNLAKETFADYDEIIFPSVAYLAYENKVISGEKLKDKLYIRPQRYITRAEIASIFNNLLKTTNNLQNKEVAAVFENQLKLLITYLQECDLDSAKGVFYDTAGVFDNIKLNNMVSEPVKKFVKDNINKFNYKITGYGYYGYNNAYLKIKINSIDLTTLGTALQELAYNSLNEENLTKIIEEFCAKGSHDKISQEVVLNFVKYNNEWKIVL